MGASRRAVSIGFLLFGVVAGSLLPRIPTLKENLHLTDGQVGIGFLAYAVGAVLGAGISRPALGRGARLPARISLVAMCAALIAPAVAPSFALLAVAFLAGGLCAGFLDPLLNAQAAAIERDAGRPMINGFHAFWSLGSIVGSVIAAGAAALSISPAIHFTAVALVLAAASVPLLAGLPDTQGGAATLLPTGTGRLGMGTALAVVAALAFLGIVVESGGGDWSAIYLRDFGHAPPDVAALGFAALSGAMTVVRFGADRLTAMSSARVVAALSGLVSAGGFVLAISFPSPPAAILGFALVGVGAAALVPLSFSAAANLDGAGNALSFVTAVGYASSIVSPPLIGGAADRFGLRLALLIPTAAGLGVLAMMASTRFLGKRTSRTSANATERVES
jgi:MFS family permease